MRIFFVGLGKVPYACRACDIRLDSFAQLCTKCGADVTVLNRYSPLGKSKDEESERPYEIKELVTHSKGGIFGKLLFLLSIIIEFCYLINYRIHHDKNAILHIYTGHYFDMLFYWIIAKICGYKILYQYVEYRLDEKRSNPYHRINAWMVDKQGAKLWDGVIAISHFLKDRALEVNPQVRTFMGPPICDYHRFATYRCEKENKVLYCGNAGYFEVIKLVVDSFSISKLSSSYKLELIISGNDEQLKRVKDYAPEAIVRTRLPYDELIKSYNRSKVLMIPLRNNVKDISRFPNKVCEYAASKSVVVTTKYGEPAHFFKDKESAMIVNDYSVASIAESLDWLADNEDVMPTIGERGYNVGLESFNTEAYVGRMKDYLNFFKG